MKAWLKENSKKIGIYGLALIAGIVLWYCCGTIKDLYSYFRLNSSTSSQIEGLSVGQVDDDRFAVAVNYSYVVEGKHYTGESFILDHLFRNAFAAEPHKKELERQVFTVFYNKSDPAISSVDKRFPTKRAVYTVILILVFVYFIKMREWIKQGKQKI
ncbi:MAG: hypothetical protein P4L16_03230 [Chlamydiales bacterium]|nr:hypothetical protein [Chlamydiales bacterium]